MSKLKVTASVNGGEEMEINMGKLSRSFLAVKPNAKITKAKIKDELFLEVEYTEDLSGHSKKDTKLSCTIPVHEDLKTAFNRLHVHLAILCDEVRAPKKADFETTEFESFFAKSFSIGGNDDNEGITISGHKEGKYGNVNLNTPFTKYESSEYPFLPELGSDIEAAVYEVEQYLFEGKRAPEKQLEMDFADGGEEDKTNAE